MVDIRSSQDVSIKDDDSGTYAQVDGRATDSKGLNILPLGEYRTASITLTDTQVVPFQMTSAGRLKVDASITAGVSQVIQTRDSTGTAKDVSFQAGSYESVPSVIVDYTTPTQRLIIDASGSALVAGKNPVGSVPATNPVYISGIDTEGKKRGILTDSTGKLQTTQGSTTARSLSFSSETNVILNSGSWYSTQKYTVPTGYSFEILEAIGWSADAKSFARVIKFISMGTHNLGTATFTDGSVYATPLFAAGIGAEVTTATGATADVTLTVTYTNQSGVAGRTTTIVVPKNTPIGYKFNSVLQSGDYGVLDVTNVTGSGNTGIVRINGWTELWWVRLATADTSFSLTEARQSLIISAGETISLDIGTNALNTTAQRVVKVIGLIDATVI